MFIRFLPWKFGWPAKGMHGLGVYRSAKDMTDYDRVRELVHWADDSLAAGIDTLVLDFSLLANMDSSLIAGIILLCRRAAANHARVKLINYPRQFITMLEVYRIHSMLENAGVIFGDHNADNSINIAGNSKPLDQEATKIITLKNNPDSINQSTTSSPAQS